MRRAILLAALAASTSHAAVPDDFAYGLRLDAPPGGSVYTVDLPMPVYVGLARPDLADLRVFNGRGAEVPHVLRLPKLLQGEATAPLAVPVYPLFGEAATQSSLAGRARIHAGGAIADLQSGRTLDGEQPTAYLVDLAAVASRPTAIELLSNRGVSSPGLVAHLSIAASDDLVHWNPVVGDATVADFDHGSDRIVRPRVGLPAFSGKYLRFDWPAAARETQITAVKAVFAAPASYPMRQWLPLEGKPGENAPHQFQFKSGGFFPVDCVRVAPRAANTVMRVNLWSRSSDKTPWRLRGEGLIYDLAVAREGLASEPFCFAPTTDPLWRLDVTPSEQGIPRLELGWTPHRLLFIARGAAPFTLAYGSAHTGPARGGDPLLRDSGVQHVALAKATVTGEPLVLGGSARRHSTEPDPRWPRIVLWSLLTGGAFVLGWIGWRLTRATG